jgi:hypothetical protein
LIVVYFDHNLLWLKLLLKYRSAQLTRWSILISSSLPEVYCVSDSPHKTKTIESEIEERKWVWVYIYIYILENGELVNKPAAVFLL